MRRSVQRLASSVQRLVLILLTFALCTLYFALPVYAQQPQTAPYLQPNTNPDVPNNLNSWTQNVMINLLSAGICQLAGINPLTPDQRCLGADPATGKIGFVPVLRPESGQVGGAIGFAGNLIAATFTHPPASTGDYLSYMSSKFGIVEKAYAQSAGTGFNGIKPLISVWEAFRNITYLFFVIIFALIGFMIMLRVKIDPRTVMTVQNSIPRIIIGLILATFSFAIAGLLIDLMYVVIFLFFGVFGAMKIDVSTTNFAYAVAGAQKIYQSDNVFALFNTIYAPGSAQNPLGNTPVVGFFSGAGAVAKDVAGALMNSITVTFGGDPKEFQPGGTIAGGIGGFLAGWAAKIAIGAAFGNIFGAIVGAILGLVTGFSAVEVAIGISPQQIPAAAAGMVAIFVVFIAVVWSLFRLSFQLILAYVWLLIDIVLAPLWILSGMIPGSPVSFSGWLREMLAQLSVFPATIFMFLLGKAFIEGFGATGDTGGTFIAPLIGAQSLQALKAFIGLGFILLTPQIANMVKDAFKPPIFKYGAAVGQAIGVGTGAPGGLMGQAQSTMSTLYYANQIKGVGNFLSRVGLGPKDK